jgi:hypothetical protein
VPWLAALVRLDEVIDDDRHVPLGQPGGPQPGGGFGSRHRSDLNVNATRRPANNPCEWV